MRCFLSPRGVAVVPIAYFASLLVLGWSGVHPGPEWAQWLLAVYFVPALLLVELMMPVLSILGLVTKGGLLVLPTEAGFVLLIAVYSGIFYGLARAVAKRCRPRDGGQPG